MILEFSFGIMEQMARKESLFALFCGISLLMFFSCARIHYKGPGAVQTGMASWYGPKFHGRTTSNREIFNMYDMTAAHRTLPFGTYVMVTNLDNGKSVTVRINDRGPFVKGRIIDVSYAAARMLDMIEPGIIPVQIELLPDQTQIGVSRRFSVQVGSFVQRTNAEALKTKLKRKYKNVYISLYETSRQIFFQVRIKAESLQDANKISRRLLDDGYSVFVLEEH